MEEEKKQPAENGDCAQAPATPEIAAGQAETPASDPHRILKELEKDWNPPPGAGEKDTEIKAEDAPAPPSSVVEPAAEPVPESPAGPEPVMKTPAQAETLSGDADKSAGTLLTEAMQHLDQLLKELREVTPAQEEQVSS